MNFHIRENSCKISFLDVWLIQNYEPSKIYIKT